jgi:hypothetical protein
VINATSSKFEEDLLLADVSCAITMVARTGKVGEHRLDLLEIAKSAVLKRKHTTNVANNVLPFARSYTEFSIHTDLSASSHH